MRRQAKRIAARGDPFSAKVKQSASKYIAMAASQALHSSLNARTLPIATGGFVGVDQDVLKEVPSVEELKLRGYKYYAWDGVYVSVFVLEEPGCSCSRTGKRKPFVVLDRDNRVVALFAGQPNDPDWAAVASEASRAMTAAAQRCSFKKGDRDHRRGMFATLALGISFGGGRTVRTVLRSMPV